MEQTEIPVRQILASLEWNAHGARTVLDVAIVPEVLLGMDSTVGQGLLATTVLAPAVSLDHFLLYTDTILCIHI